MRTHFNRLRLLIRIFAEVAREVSVANKLEVEAERKIKLFAAVSCYLFLSILLLQTS